MSPHENERLRLKAEVFKAMGHPLRLGVIELLQTGEKCVCEIVEQVGTEISNVSKHLSVSKRQASSPTAGMALKLCTA